MIVYLTGSLWLLGVVLGSVTLANGIAEENLLEQGNRYALNIVIGCFAALAAIGLLSSVL